MSDNTRPLRSTFPVGHLLNSQTAYKDSVNTDIRKTFQRIRNEQAKRKQEKPCPTAQCF